MRLVMCESNKNQITEEDSVNQKKKCFIQKIINGTPSPTRTDMNRSSTDFESVASTNSAIGAN